MHVLNFSSSYIPEKKKEVKKGLSSSPPKRVPRLSQMLKLPKPVGNSARFYQAMEEGRPKVIKRQDVSKLEKIMNEYPPSGSNSLIGSVPHFLITEILAQPPSHRLTIPPNQLQGRYLGGAGEEEVDPDVDSQSIPVLATLADRTYDKNPSNITTYIEAAPAIIPPKRGLKMLYFNRAPRELGSPGLGPQYKKKVHTLAEFANQVHTSNNSNLLSLGDLSSSNSNSSKRNASERMKNRLPPLKPSTYLAADQLIEEDDRELVGDSKDFAKRIVQSKFPYGGESGVGTQRILPISKEVRDISPKRPSYLNIGSKKNLRGKHKLLRGDQSHVNPYYVQWKTNSKSQITSLRLNPQYKMYHSTIESPKLGARGMTQGKQTMSLSRVNVDHTFLSVDKSLEKTYDIKKIVELVWKTSTQKNFRF